MSKLSKAELKERDARKGLVPQRERPPKGKLKPVLLEYYVEEYQVGWRHRKSGWCRQGNYKSREQALRVIEGLRKDQAVNNAWNMFSSKPPQGCKWRIDGEDVERF